MDNRFSRTARVVGESNLEKINNSSVVVFGLGGVGGAACEALVRAGVGTIGIVDKDVVDITNINRQIIATDDTVGLKKTDAMEKRLLSINPDEQYIDKNGAFDISKCNLIAYANGGYYLLGKKIGKFGYSVEKKKTKLRKKQDKK